MIIFLLLYYTPSSKPKTNQRIPNEKKENSLFPLLSSLLKAKQKISGAGQIRSRWRNRRRRYSVEHSVGGWSLHRPEITQHQKDVDFYRDWMMCILAYCNYDYTDKDHPSAHSYDSFSLMVITNIIQMRKSMILMFNTMLMLIFVTGGLQRGP